LRNTGLRDKFTIHHAIKLPKISKKSSKKCQNLFSVLDDKARRVWEEIFRGRSREIIFHEEKLL
jgi:hypothetical protein